MKLLPREWDIIILALKDRIRKLEDSSRQGFPGNEYERIQEIKILIERIELNRKPD